MKKICTLFLTVFTVAAGISQTIIIPDNNFKLRLISGNYAAFDADGTDFSGNVDTNNDGEIQISEALAVTGLNVSTSPSTTTGNISSLEGIENFTSLKVLSCSGNDITTLDATPFSFLTTLHCRNNELTNLNISGLSNLEELFCNNNSLSSLNFENTPALKKVNISVNEIVSADLSTVEDLESLIAYQNQLTTLSVSNLANLHGVWASENLLTSIDLTGLPNLRSLMVDNNLLEEISLNEVPNIEILYLSDNLITEIDLENSPLLMELEINNNFLSVIDASNTAIKLLHSSNNPELTSINVQNGVYSSSDPDLLYFAFQLENLPVLTSVCVDNGEQGNLNHTDYNSGGNAVVYTGENCDVVAEPMSSAKYEYMTVKMYPNPAADFVTLDLLQDNGINKVAIVNVMGQVVKEESITQNNISLNISDLASGTYILRLSGDKKSGSYKLIKQ